MATITYYPPPNGPQGPLEVRTDTMISTFEPGVPAHVFEEDRASLVTAIQASFANVVSPAATITPQGTAGTTSYSYRIVAYNANGDTLPGTVGSTSTGNATLTGTNYNQITWPSAFGATGYKIWRTVGGATPGVIGNVSSVQTSFNDTGLTANAYGAAGAAVSAAGVLTTNAEQ